METVGNDRRDLVRAIYRQQCSHVRHAENQRLWFTLIYVILCTGSFIVMRGELFHQANWPVIAFLMLLSLFGLFFCLRAQTDIRVYTGVAELILSRYSLGHYLVKCGANKTNRLFTMSRLFPIFFLLLFSFFLFVIVQIIFQPGWRGWLGPLLIFVAGTVAVFCWECDESSRSDEG